MTTDRSTSDDDSADDSAGAGAAHDAGRGGVDDGLDVTPPTIAPRRPLTTTHDPAWGGSARLAVIAGTSSWVDGGRLVCHLLDPMSSIGSHADCDIVLAGLAPRHAWIHHDDDDEYVLDSRRRDVRVNGVVALGRMQLRTGSRLQIGPHLLAFVRDEYADHGRPYGGREGGEFGVQLPQEPRRSRPDPTAPDAG